MLDETENRGHLYLSVYARASKRSHRWTVACSGLIPLAKIQQGYYMPCNDDDDDDDDTFNFCPNVAKS
jgi:Zn-dependent oligopeptidase